MLRCGDFPVLWCGFESSTYRLSQSGWDVAVHYNPSYLAYQMFFRHQMMSLSAITDERTFQDLMSYKVPFQVQAVAPRIDVHSIPVVQNLGSNQWRQIDCTPTSREIHELNPENIFRYAKQDDELVVDKADLSVVEHLEAIKSLQSEKQKELREKARHAKQGMTVHMDANPNVKREVIANVVQLHAVA